MEIVRLKGADWEEATDFLDLVFSTAYGPTRFRELLPLLYRPTDEHMGHNFALRENGRIRAIVGLFPEQVQAGDTVLRLSGIGGVSAHPNDRGRGWMRALMDRCVREMEEDGTDLSFLTGLRQRYRYFGYEKTGISLRYTLGAHGMRHFFRDAPPADGLRFSPLTREDGEALDHAKRLHDAQPLYCIRSTENFLLHLFSMGGRPWAVRYPDGSPAGYLVFEAGRRTVTEAFADSAAVFAELIRGWFAEQGGNGMDVLLAPWQRDEARTLAAFAESAGVTDCGNWRIFRWDRVTDSLLKLRAAGERPAEGAVTLEIADWGGLRIEVSDRGTVCERTSAAPDVRLPAHIAAQLLFGPMPFSFLTELPERVQPLAASWFPLPLCWLRQNYV